MHMRVLLAISGGRQFGEVAEPIGVAHMRIEKVDRPQRPGQRVSIASETEVPPEREQDERVIVEIGSRVDYTAAPIQHARPAPIRALPGLADQELVAMPGEIGTIAAPQQCGMRKDIDLPAITRTRLKSTAASEPSSFSCSTYPPNVRSTPCSAQKGSACSNIQCRTALVEGSAIGSRSRRAPATSSASELRR